LFIASQAPWVSYYEVSDRNIKNNFITDEPFIYKASNGDLLLLKSSFKNNIYAIGASRSSTGSITWPLVHDNEALYSENAGHGMAFITFENKLMLTIQTPNESPNERPIFFELEEVDGVVSVKIYMHYIICNLTKN
jgi:arabinan endo-1,5-alpha-L-arabinosidase